MRFDAAGVQSERQGQSGRVDWKSVQQVDETGDHFFLPIDRNAAFIIPKRSAGPLSPEAFGCRRRTHPRSRRWRVSQRLRRSQPIRRRLTRSCTA